MKLWLLYPKEPAETAPLFGRDFWGYDCAYGFVVRAETEARARELAEEQSGDESGHGSCHGGKWIKDNPAWLSRERTTCEELHQDGDESIVIRNYRAG